MDYKYIEQLMERYFNCETSLQEEQILRSFFQQEEIPAELLPYRDLFRYEEEEVMEEKLGDDFDARILAMVEQPTVKAKPIPLRTRLYPFFKAAAAIAIVLTVGNAAQHSFSSEDNDFQQSNVQPEMGYQQSTSALEMTAEELSSPATKTKEKEKSVDTLAVLTDRDTGL